MIARACANAKSSAWRPTSPSSSACRRARGVRVGQARHRPDRHGIARRCSRPPTRRRPCAAGGGAGRIRGDRAAPRPMRASARRAIRTRRGTSTDAWWNASADACDRYTFADGEARHAVAIASALAMARSTSRLPRDGRSTARRRRADGRLRIDADGAGSGATVVRAGATTGTCSRRARGGG